MDYQSKIEHSYEYTLPQGMTSSATAFKVILFFRDGSIESTDYDTSTQGNSVLELTGQVVNYCNRTYPNNKIVAFEVVNYNNGYLSQYFYTNYVDYVITGESAVIQVVKYNNFGSDLIGGFSYPSDYPSYTYSKFQSYSYGVYGAIKNTDSNHYLSVYDFSNIHYEDFNYYNDVYVIRGENYSFYTHSQLNIQYTHGAKYFAYGRPLAKERESEYQRGYGNGHSEGWIEGIDEGYQQGINANGVTSANINTPMAVIGTAFNGVAGLMNIEVLPNITLGLCFSIPLVFVLIMTIFKLVRK